MIEQELSWREAVGRLERGMRCRDFQEWGAGRNSHEWLGWWCCLEIHVGLWERCFWCVEVATYRASGLGWLACQWLSQGWAACHDACLWFQSMKHCLEGNVVQMTSNSKCPELKCIVSTLTVWRSGATWQFLCCWANGWIHGITVQRRAHRMRWL